MLLDTIAAISTPIGEGGLAVVWFSGLVLLVFVCWCFRAGGARPLALAEVPTHTVHYGKIERDGKPIDEVMLTVFRAPRTFTREEMIEISCHGGVLPAKLVLDALLAA